MSCSASFLSCKLENFESKNPLECLICDREFTSPVRLACQHSFCKKCIESKSACSVCGGPIEGEFVSDTLLAYLIDTSHEVADVCANCDQVSQPMHFCETCQQALCNECRQSTHQAKMFSLHRVVPLEERAKVKGKVTCPLHGEPFILYSVKAKTLACIVCFNNASVDSRHNLVSIDTAHNVGCEKLGAASMKLRNFQEESYEQIELRKKLVDELDESHHIACSNIRRMCQEMIDTIVMVRERLLNKLNEEKSLRESHFNEQIKQLITLQPTIRLCLLGASIFCSSASKLDFLLFSTDLIKRIQAILSMACEKPQYTGELSVNTREELSAALEPFLGLSTVLLSTGRPCGINGIIRKCNSTTNYQFGYTNGSTPVSRKYQLVVDLAGAFGEQFAKIEVPLKQFSHDMAVLGKKVQETQRDLTLRKCVVEKNAVTDLTCMCFDLYSKLSQQSTLINELQPQLQQIWQEQLDRVRRQQILFREKVEETLTLRDSAQHVANAARQLEPFAACLAAVTSVIDWRRCHRPELAPMESICLQINTIEPNSQHRIEAIQKEENNRRLALDQKKREEQMQFYAVKKHLKTTKEQRKLKREFLKDSMSRPRLVNTNRDRSPGGTDRALLSPCHRRTKGCSSVGSRSQSDVEEVESSMDDSFEFTAESSSAETETVKIEMEHHFCKSNPLRLSVPISVRSSHKEHKCPASTSLPDVDEISRRIAAASESGADDGQQRRSNESRYNVLKIPQVPYVPTTVFAGVTPDAPFRGTYECREKLLESLKQKVSRVEIGATFAANREVGLE